MLSTLPWFSNRFPLYLAPMAGVSDRIFRQLCKEHGADILITEFVSAEGVFRRDQRTREYLDFDEIERPIGVQLFGADVEHMAAAARQVIDWVVPDFIDLNFGCPVNRNGALASAAAVAKRCHETGIAGAMIGRAAMSAPWVFSQTKHYLATGEIPDAPELPERWNLILRHCQLAVRQRGAEEPAMRSMRARLMAYSRAMPDAKRLRETFSHVFTVSEVNTITQQNILRFQTQITHNREIPVLVAS